MSNVNKTGRPSLSSVISKPITNKPSIKTNTTQINKPTNAYTSQTTLLSRSKIPKTPTCSTPPHTPTPIAPAPLPSSTSTATSDINNQVITTNITSHNTNRNYASAASNENSPSREQALVFNSIDGIPQRDYIVAIGKIIPPKNIVFVSRISNNRFCIFLSSKQILDSLLEATQTITINDQIIQIRRLINPAKRIVISNVCPSIPNHVILDALKNINVIPVSEIAYLKAGINIEGYEHILSFRRQMFIKHEEYPNLPGSLPLLHNQTEYRVFFTDDRITCFLCKSTGHTSNNCKKINVNPQTATTPVQPEPVEEPPLEEPSLYPHTSISTPEMNISSPSSKKNPNNPHMPPQIMEGISEDHQTNDTPQPSSHNQAEKTEINFNAPCEPHKRLLSENSSPTIPASPPKAILNTDRSRNSSKKAKVDRSRSNSSSKIADKISDGLKPAEDIFSNDSPISLHQFKYVLENYTNKNLNIHNICKDINSDITSLMFLIDSIRPKVTERTTKAQLTRLANFLFQALPPSQDN